MVMGWNLQRLPERVKIFLAADFVACRRCDRLPWRIRSLLDRTVLELAETAAAGLLAAEHRAAFIAAPISPTILPMNASSFAGSTAIPHLSIFQKKDRRHQYRPGRRM